MCGIHPRVGSSRVNELIRTQQEVTLFGPAFFKSCTALGRYISIGEELDEHLETLCAAAAAGRGQLVTST